MCSANLPGEFVAVEDEVLSELLLPRLGVPDLLDDNSLFRTVANQDIILVDGLGGELGNRVRVQRDLNVLARGVVARTTSQVEGTKSFVQLESRSRNVHVPDHVSQLSWTRSRSIGVASWVGGHGCRSGRVKEKDDTWERR